MPARRIDAMFRGDKINITENWAVLRGAARAGLASIDVDGGCGPDVRGAG